jgi:hypothetical protein
MSCKYLQKRFRVKKTRGALFEVLHEQMLEQLDLAMAKELYIGLKIEFRHFF